MSNSYKKKYLKNHKNSFYKNLNQNLPKLNILKQKLPELNNCDNIINHWSKELLTIFENECKKSWDKGKHLSVRTKSNRSIFIYVTTNIKIIENDNKLPFDRNTVIFISTANSKEATMFYWENRYEISKYNYIEKIDKNIFRIWNSEKSEIKTYNQAKQVGYLKDIQRFQNQSLVALCLQQTRKQGTINSNKNSQTQSLRKKGKIVKGCEVLMEFDCAEAYTKETKTMLDAYRIVAGKYNYIKSYRTFVREIKTGQRLIFNMDDLHTVYCSLVVSTTQLINIIPENLNLNNNSENTIIKRDVDTSKINNSITEPEILTEEEKLIIKLRKDYDNWRKDLPEESWWTFEEYCDLQKA